MTPVPRSSKRWLSLRAWLVVACLAPLAFGVTQALAASIDSIGFSADPVEDQSVAVTVAGSSETPRSLFVLRHTGTGSCAATASAEDASSTSYYLSESYGDSVSGTFNKIYAFTPTDAGTYRVCAYVAASASGAPAANQTATVSVRLPTASINAPTFSADPAEDKSLTTTISGTSEATRSLFVLRHNGSSDCAATASAEDASSTSYYLSESYGDSVSASFSRPYTFTPTDAGTYRICAYIARGQSSSPLASQTATVAVRLPTASISAVSFSADPATASPLTSTVSGSSEATRSIFVLRHTGSTPCAATASAEDASSTSYYLSESYGDSVSDSFSRPYTFTPGTSGTYRICAYVARGGTSTPLASRTEAVDVRLPHQHLNRWSSSRLSQG
jgi:hypothetical protein